MKLRKPIVIWMNNKKQTKFGQDRRKRRRVIRDEQASTVEHTKNDDSIPTFERSHSFPDKHKGYRLFGKGQKGRHLNLKPILVAILSAVVVGGLLGFIMLNMFNGIGYQTNGESGQQNLAGTGSESDASKTTAQGSSMTLPSLSAFVLQGGVFSTQDNAKQWVETFQQAEHPAAIWEREGQFTLLAGLAETEEQAKALAADFTDEDIYIKEWSTEEADIEGTDQEQKWLQAFVDRWNDSVHLLSSENELDTEAWQKLMNDFPKQASHLAAFQKQLAASFKEMTDGNNAEQTFLLEQWQQYEKLAAAQE
ncbi:hypothetical protein WMZ97_20715 [Lentibacillus sp. N15]|uniref:hypothetical protein n=1 Tax=Lentibacillus songyuanensis TaxID=3136161 RepID=UPI0031BA7960